MKPGYKTTEFWLTLMASVVGFVIASGVMDSLAETHWAVKLVGAATVLLSALGYTTTRGKVKTAETDKATAEALSNGSNT